MRHLLYTFVLLGLMVPVLVHAQHGADESGYEATAAAHEAGHHTLDWKLLSATVLNFIILLLVLGVFARKPLQNFLSTRRDSIQKELELAERLKTQAEAKLAEYTKRLAELDQELAKVRAEMLEAGKAERNRIVAEAEVKANRMRKEAEFLISQQVKQLRMDILQEASMAAIHSARELLQSRLTAADQERLARDFLKQLAQISKNNSNPQNATNKAATNRFNPAEENRS